MNVNLSEIDARIRERDAQMRHDGIDVELIGHLRDVIRAQLPTAIEPPHSLNELSDRIARAVYPWVGR